ncbi:MAG TPA: glycosyltransferase, partial [Phycisphaerae bacterium]|nr:glycosyltransferase [Phycisphaerae bacterium]
MPNPLRIIHLVTSLSVAAGGTATAVLAYAAGLAAAGQAIEIVSFDRGPFAFAWGSAPPPGLKVSLFPSHGRDNAVGPELIAHLQQRLKEKPDALHLHGMWQPLNVKAAALARTAGVPYVCSIHGMLDPWSVRQRALKKRIYFALAERKRLAHSAALHFTARQEAAKATPWLPAHVKQVIIPILIDLSPYAALPSRSEAGAMHPAIPPDMPWVLFLSRIHEKKGLDLLIDAVAVLPDKRVQLVVAGDGEAGYVAAMKERAKRAGIAERAHFVGLVRGAAKTALFRRADVLVLPTSQENFGIVFPEALACETPVLTTQGVDIHEELVGSGGAMLIQREAGDIAGK